MTLPRLAGRKSADRRRGAVGRPMLWFAGASLLAVVALGFAATAILRRQARDEAIRNAKEITRLAGEGIAEPAVSDRLLSGDRAAVEPLKKAPRKPGIRAALALTHSFAAARASRTNIL